MSFFNRQTIRLICVLTFPRVNRSRAVLFCSSLNYLSLLLWRTRPSSAPRHLILWDNFDSPLQGTCTCSKTLLLSCLGKWELALQGFRDESQKHLDPSSCYQFPSPHTNSEAWNGEVWRSRPAPSAARGLSECAVSQLAEADLQLVSCQKAALSPLLTLGLLWL